MGNSGTHHSVRFQPSKVETKRMAHEALLSEEDDMLISHYEHDQSMVDAESFGLEMSNAQDEIDALNEEFDRQHTNEPLDLSVMAEEAEAQKSLEQFFESEFEQRRLDNLHEEFLLGDEAEFYQERQRNMGI